MMIGDFTPALYLIKLLDVLEAQGITIQPLLIDAGITAKEIENRESDVPIGKYLKVVEASVASAAIPDLGFLVGKHTSPLEHGVLGYALLSSPNLKESLQRYIRYQNLPGPLLTISFEHDEQQAKFIAEPRKDIVPLSALTLRYFVQEWLVGWNQWGRIIGANNCFFEQVKFGFASDGNESLYEKYLGCPVSFGHDVTEATFPVEYLNRSLEYAEKTVGSLCADQCERLLETLRLERGLTAEIYRHLANSPGNLPKMETMAAMLCVSVRTLRRHLLKERTTYQQVVVEFRMAMARRYLIETPLATNEIAELVGYADTANFYHTFRKEFGTTPQQYRISSTVPAL